MSEFTWVDYVPYSTKDGLLDEPSAEELKEWEEERNELFEEDDFPDADFSPKINAKFPGWFLVRMYGFSWNTMGEVKDWCRDNTKFGGWEAVGWESGCSTSVGVVFENSKDAMMFKLRWR